jgi:hypothetical protein
MLLAVVVVLAACKKETVISPSFSEAVYKVTFTGQWKTPQHALPPGAHFTPIIGMVHNNTTFMYKPGSLASLGVEAVAEDGNSFPLIREVDSLIALKKAVSNPIYFVTPINGPSTITIYCNDRYPLFSCMSMLAPTPDWFLGVNAVDLRRGTNNWASDTTIQVYAYDAGTEERDIFNQDNAPTVPQQPVTPLSPANASVLANGNATIAPVATLRFVRQ